MILKVDITFVVFGTEISIKDKDNEAVDLLIESSENFYYSQILLSLFLIKKFGFDMKIIKSEFENKFKISKYLI